MNFTRSSALVLVWLSVIQFSSSCSSDKRATEPRSEGGQDCSNLEPTNPYQPGTGHYAGFKWGEERKSCGGNSTSFVEGCEDYEAQEDEYNSCLSKGKQ
jgi:hypothetical protein